MEGGGGQYLGEISALCFLHLPSSFSSLPLLLAGSGSQIILFDVHLGVQIESFCVFEGVRVHGISSSLMGLEEDVQYTSVSFKVVISGEKRVKLYSLHIQMGSESVNEQHLLTNLKFMHQLPRFSHWVLDFCFLEDGSHSYEGHCRYLAIGCNDNSVYVWDMLTSSLIYEIICPERCLLYSMKFWGHHLNDLHIASGTILNEIVVWKLVCRHHTPPATRAGQDVDVTHFVNGIHPLDGLNYESEIISKLAGHQGSIFCLSWSSDGSKLVSVSDDRSARMWITDDEMKRPDNCTKSFGSFSAGPMLFGHGARVWDCCISDAFIVTAGEDCTCRVWGLDGKELRVIKEHIGRGIWRCLYDPKSSLLVTAGFDAAIKVHSLQSLLSAFSGDCMVEAEERKEEIYKVCIPNLSAHSALMDSKSEYVRCLKFARKDMIYVATNHGFVYHGKLLESGSVEWTELIRSTEKVPLVCMDFLSRNMSESSLEYEDWIAVGDGRGTMKVVKVVFIDGAPQVPVRFSWSAEMERQLLGAYWCKSLGCRFVYTSNPRGLVKLWRLSDSSSSDALRNCDAYLVADFVSPFGARIVCLDASLEEEILVCGDLRGNLVLYPLIKRILLDDFIPNTEKISSLTYFKGAHGISIVSSISIVSLSSSLAEICSTGGDKCICYLEYNKYQQTLEFVGMRHVKDLSLVHSVSAEHLSLDSSANISYAVGFTSTDFLIWNLHSETKVMQVNCGGWRRPHSYYLGQNPELCSCFAYVKDEIIYMHRYWVPDDAKKIFSGNLNMQFHGREIHSLCFILGDNLCATPFHHPNMSWIATGCEGGTVRLTRYNHGTNSWDMSNLLGEHVGGSAVRSLCFVSKVYCVETKVVEATNGTCGANKYMENSENSCLLISVGAKRVITSWLLRKGPKIDNDALTDGVENDCGSGKAFSGQTSSLSFKWLSTDMPVKSVRSQNKAQTCEKVVRPLDEDAGADSISASVNEEPNQSEDALDNDWRYLAVTSFLVKIVGSRITVCFVVVACSDATLMLRALVLPYRYWFDVASLAPLLSPVLALQHVVAPVTLPYEGQMMTRNMYIVISGSTDGSISFWDVTNSIEEFLLRVPSFHVEKSIDFQKRPRTGRGSQGGRWWKSVNVAKERSEGSLATNDDIVTCENAVADNAPPTIILEGTKLSSNHSNHIGIDSSISGGSFDNSANLSEIKPLHILHNVHQSGVNCLHVCCENFGSILSYSIVSGGDDQALSFMQFVVAPSPAISNMDGIVRDDMTSRSRFPEDNIQCGLNQNCSIKFLHQSRAVPAHSSAVKGVWTDGMWIFSSGLDQRLRCWKFNGHGSLIEHGHIITSVPEPEALDVRACGSNCYQVVVAGRGMQMVEISLSLDKEIQ